ncbi:MAG: hypothetical protein JXN60_06110 [Lentisphaerae bacterium]|nr:hypothetical protein [Lentisphaerota bacterium]
MIPDLQSSLLCDDVRQERNGKFILIGLFDAVGVPVFPAVFQKICIVNRWCSGKGIFEQQSRILGCDGTTPVVEGKPLKIHLPDDQATATSVEFFLNVRFEKEGSYWVEILLENDLKIRYPIKVARVIPQKQKMPPSDAGQ